MKTPGLFLRYVASRAGDVASALKEFEKKVLGERARRAPPAPFSLGGLGQPEKVLMPELESSAR